ncbi:MAG: glycosyltransferase [Anaeroplasmataceae bacterium]|nr:glycosyltransferase [Anaeroplasmataceae bacterium]
MFFYITFIDFSSSFGTGMDKKIKGQIAAMKKELGEIYFTLYSAPMLYLMDEEEVIMREVAPTRKDRISVLCDWMQKYGVEGTYIRHCHLDKWFMDLLKYQKEHGIKTVLEIATYPYDKELQNVISRTEDMCFRNEVCKYVDRIATYSSDRIIWGIPCIRLLNGISLQDISLSRREKEKNKIVMIAISSMQPWHGYERVLEGMYVYYKAGGAYDFRLKIIGNGSEEQYYKMLVEQYRLTSQVEFLGRIEPWETDKLNEQYNLSDIAIGSLGFYKTGIEEGSPIKGAEYCAKGIPFICGYNDLRFPSDWEYVMNVPNSSEPIDMDSLIDFYDSVAQKRNYKEEMRDFAMKHLTWDSIMRPIIDYFLK